MGLPLSFGLHPHVQQDGPGYITLAVLSLVRRPTHIVAIDEGIRHGPDEGVLGGRDERQGGRPFDAPPSP